MGRLEKHTVCVDCLCVGISDPNCICTYQDNHKTIELEFEVCECCGKIISDGFPADTKFNQKQFDINQH